MKPDLAKDHSISSQPEGQPGGALLPRLASAPVLLVCLLGFLGCGCHNIYQEGKAIYPADASERLRLQIEEAQQAEQRAAQAAATLRDEQRIGSSPISTA